MTYICEKARECKTKGLHCEPHSITESCKTSYCYSTKKQQTCIPIEEIGYTLNERGYSIGHENDCRYGIGYINIGTYDGCTIKGMAIDDNHPKCQYFYGLDREKQVIWCAYKSQHKEEGKMFKIGDRVKLISTKWGDKINNPVWDGKHGRVEGKVAEVSNPSSSNPYLVRWDNGEENSYDKGDLELITEEKMEKKYEAIKDFTKYDYIIAHQKKYTWTKFKDSSVEFQEDMDYWCNDSCLILNTKELPKGFSDNFYKHAVMFGFIKEVKEEVYYKKGDHFTKDGHEYLLYSYGFGSDGMNLVDINTGDKFDDSNFIIKNSHKIPTSEFHAWAGKDMVKI
jgi:hypothetical protein